MPIYFFDLIEDGNEQIDDVGQEFGTLDEAADEARRALASIAKDEIEGGLMRHLQIRVRDGDEGPFVLEVTIREGPG